MYVAVKGGEKAIDNAHRLLAEERRGDTGVPELTIAQIKTQMALAVDRVMNEGSLFDSTLAALAIKQAHGDLVEAIFLLRAYRTTLPRFGYSEPLETAKMAIRRRISATFKDLPGGQILGPTFDYTHRLLDFSLLDEGANEHAPANDTPLPDETMTRVVELLDHEGLVEHEPAEKEGEVGDLTRESLTLPAERDVCLQQLVRGDEGFLLAMGYSSQRGYGRNHPFAGEIRMGTVAVEFVPEELGFAIDIGEITVTECQMINQFKGTDETPPQFTRGYGLTFGYCERKAMAMALVERALRSESLGEEATAPVQDQEFMMYHMDNVSASGFVQHLKLPHYVDFQSELETVRRLRREFHERRNKADAAE